VHVVLEERVEVVHVDGLLVVNGHKCLLLKDVVKAGGPLAAAKAGGVTAGSGGGAREGWRQQEQVRATSCRRHNRSLCGGSVLR
jgi:hypothetical protein